MDGDTGGQEVKIGEVEKGEKGGRERRRRRRGKS